MSETVKSMFTFYTEGLIPEYYQCESTQMLHNEVIGVSENGIMGMCRVYHRDLVSLYENIKLRISVDSNHMTPDEISTLDMFMRWLNNMIQKRGYCQSHVTYEYRSYPHLTIRDMYIDRNIIRNQRVIINAETPSSMAEKYIQDDVTEFLKQYNLGMDMKTCIIEKETDDELNKFTITGNVYWDYKEED